MTAQPDLDPPTVGDVVAFPGSATLWRVYSLYDSGTIALRSLRSRRTMVAEPGRVYVVRRA